MILFTHGSQGYSITDTAAETTTTYPDRESWIAACSILLVQAGERLEAGVRSYEGCFLRHDRPAALPTAPEGVDIRDTLPTGVAPIVNPATAA